MADARASNSETMSRSRDFARATASAARVATTPSSPVWRAAASRAATVAALCAPAASAASPDHPAPAVRHAVAASPDSLAS